MSPEWWVGVADGRVPTLHRRPSSGLSQTSVRCGALRGEGVSVRSCEGLTVLVIRCVDKQTKRESDNVGVKLYHEAEC